MRGRVYKVKNFRTKWKDGWEKIEPSKVPRWVLYSGVYPDYFQCVELKGKHYRYLICSEPREQGDKRLTYYRKLRRKWRKKRKHKKDSMSEEKSDKGKRTTTSDRNFPLIVFGCTPKSRH